MKPGLHHSIVAQAVHELFLVRGDVASQFGLPESALTAQLVKGQDIPDRVFGPTWIPASVAPDAQVEHAMARPPETGLREAPIGGRLRGNVTGRTELARIKSYLVKNTALARASNVRGHSLNGAETEHIGRAIHCIMDSYSGAHTTRDYSNGVNWDAPLIGLHVFGWVSGTHEGDLDKGEENAPGGTRLERPSDRAAIAGVFNYLVAYITDREGGALSTATNDFIERAFRGEHVQIFESDNDRRVRETRVFVHGGEVCAD